MMFVGYLYFGMVVAGTYFSLCKTMYVVIGIR